MKTRVIPLIFAFFTLSTAVTAAESVPTQPTKEHYQLPSEVAKSASRNSSLSMVSRNSAVSQSYQSSAWFHTVDLTLRYDSNSNGFYSQLYARFDAHTDYNSQPVYAVYSLIDGNGTERVIHTSSIFTLYGQSRDDWFAIETDLTQLRTGYYKLLIELVDAETGYLLAEISGYDTATLDRLALEDQSRDSHVEVIVREESGGSFGIFGLLALSFGYLWRRKYSIDQNTALSHQLLLAPTYASDGATKKSD